ncbi:MAG: hypothetical protein I3J02_06520 [Prevotella sp.]|nr:hypothetical protein [Prevotella sp.]
MKIDYRPWTNVKGFTSLYWGKDRLRITEENIPKNRDKDDKDANEMLLNWGNFGVSTGMSWRITPTSLLTATGFVSQYGSLFRQDHDEFRTVKKELQHRYSHKNNKNGILDLGANATFRWEPSKWYMCNLGVEYTHHQYRPVELSVDGNDENYQGQSLRQAERTEGDEMAAFIGNEVNIGKIASLSLGLRGAKYTLSNNVYQHLEPRVSMRFLINTQLSIKTSYTRMHQYVMQVCNSNINLPTDSWQPVGDHSKPIQSDQLSIGLYGNLPHNLYFSIEGYYKWMSNLLEYREGVNVFSAIKKWEDKFAVGRGYAYGIDLGLHKDEGQLTGSLNYSLLWNRRSFAEVNGGETFPAKYDNRHKINLSVRYELNKKIELNGAWTYMSGNRITMSLYNYKGLGTSGYGWDFAPVGDTEDAWNFSYFPRRNNYRIPATHRLDVGVSFHHHFRSGHERIWSFGLYNAYCHLNAITVVKGIDFMDYWAGKKDYDAQYKILCLLPILPSFSYTFKF